MRYPISLALLAFLLGACAKNQNIESGISIELAKERKSIISQLGYDLQFNIPKSQKDSIRASASIVFDLTEVPSLLQLDFNEKAEKIKRALVNDQSINILHQQEHLLIKGEWLREGSNRVDIDFVAGDKSLNRNPDYLYTLFVPDRASTCFPNFDQPDLKATYKLKLQVPVEWLAISNGAILSVDTSGGTKTYTFAKTRELSTYHFAFAAGKFMKASNRNMMMLYRETDSTKVKANLDKIFELHEQSLNWLETYTGINYPYGKFDFALIPSFQYGGMEHPGSIFYRESSILLDPSASINQELRRASLIAHETAHMWFGNLVTMKWFNDVWLKEVFANLMAAKIVNPAFPEINHDLRFLMSHYPAAYDVDRSKGTHPIQQELKNLKNAGTLYGSIIYQKAPIMMRNLEKIVGEENFRLGLQDYLKTYSYNNASWDDLIRSLEKVTSNDLDVWNRAWIKHGGMPQLIGATTDHRLAVSTANDDNKVIWPQAFQYLIKLGMDEQVVDFDITESKSVVKEINVDANFLVIPNYKGKGYGYFKTGPESQDYMLRHVNDFDDPEVRAGIWMLLWENLLHGELNPEELIRNILLNLEREKNPLVLEYLSGKIVSLYWQFLPQAKRQLLNESMDDLLFELIALEKDQSLKRSLYDCYRNVAMSPEGLSNLKKFWSDEITLGIELSERDHINLAYELALRDVDDAAEILNLQLQKIKNPDRRNQMQFVIPALSSNTSVRNSFFESLRNPENRAHEPWVLEALQYLHHPLRSEESIKYILPSLEMLEEIQLTGDIFFPKGWLDATLADYSSKEAAKIVNQYLDQHPQLPDYLRNKLLQSADMLFRAHEILNEDFRENL